MLSNQMLRTAYRGALISRSMSQRSLMGCLQKRNVSLLINDQFLEEDQKLIQKTAYEFAEQELRPNAAEWDEKKHFPRDVYKRAAELGFAAIYISEKYGGCGLGRLEASLIFEALSSGKSLASICNILDSCL